MIECNNPILLNVTYIKPSKQNGNKEYFEVIYKTQDGTVHKVDEPAEADIYIVKPEYRNYERTKPQELISHMNKVRVPISKIRYKIAEEAGEWGKNIIRRAYDERNFKLLNQLYKWPYCYGCDFQPEYYYMKNWYEKYPLENIKNDIKLTESFLDIEADGIDHQIDMDNIPNSAYAPVNVLTIIFGDLQEVYTLVLKPYEPSRLGRSEEEYKERYALYEKQNKDHEWLTNNMPLFIKDLEKSFEPVYGKLKFFIRDYDKEINLIADLFRLINTKKPNFCEIWNMRFDIQYLYYRIIALGYDPKSIMCHKDFKQATCYFKVDRSTYMIKKQYDYFYCSSYTQFICQMRNFASIRKNQHELPSLKLNAIADMILKDKKVEYPEETNFIEFPYKDWIKFIKYNVKDALLQYGIAKKTKDIMSYYMRSHSNLTPYNKIYKETHLLRNVREIYFEKPNVGKVQSNNLNIIDEDEDELERRFYGNMDEEDDEKSSFKGAINADPIWNDKVGIRVIDSRSNNVFKNAMDYDMGAFYPSCKIASNMDPETLLYKACFVNEEFISGEFSNRSLNTKYIEIDKNGNRRKLDFTGEAVNTFVGHNILTFGYNFLGLPDISTLNDEVLKELGVS